MLTFKFSGADGVMTVAETLTSGMVGKQVKLEFTSDWDNLKKTAVFAAGCITKDVVDVSDTVTIPHEILAKPGSLHVGVYGYSTVGTVVIPTIMVRGPRILHGADPSGDESADPSLPVWEQLLGMIGDLRNLTTEARDNLVNAINEAALSGGGGINEHALQEAINKALAQAKASGEFDGEDGQDGVTFRPNVRSDGYLEWSNNVGAPNPAPAKVKGDPGKSAYAYAQEGGYTGTEEEFAEMLAKGSGGGGLSITDDGAGNVTIAAAGSVSITDDGAGNVVIA